MVVFVDLEDNECGSKSQISQHPYSTSHWMYNDPTKPEVIRPSSPTRAIEPRPDATIVCSGNFSSLNRNKDNPAVMSMACYPYALSLLILTLFVESDNCFEDEVVEMT